MTFLEPFLEAVEAGESLPTNLMGAAIRAGQAEGLSNTGILNELRSSGFSVRTQTFYQMAGEIATATERAGDIAELPANTALDESSYTEWHGGATNTYLHRVSLFITESEQGVLTSITKDWDVLSNEPLSPAEAEQRAMDSFNEHASSGRYPRQTVYGAMLRGAYHQLGAG